MSLKAMDGGAERSSVLLAQLPDRAARTRELDKAFESLNRSLDKFNATVDRFIGTK